MTWPRAETEILGQKKVNPGWSGPGVLVSIRSWLRGADSNRRPSGYEPDELPLLHPASASIAQAAKHARRQRGLASPALAWLRPAGADCTQLSATDDEPDDERDDHHHGKRPVRVTQVVRREPTCDQRRNDEANRAGRSE